MRPPFVMCLLCLSTCLSSSMSCGNLFQMNQLSFRQATVTKVLPHNDHTPLAWNCSQVAVTPAEGVTPA